MCRNGGKDIQGNYRHGRSLDVFVIDTEEIDKGTLEEGFPDGRALRD